MKKKHSANVSHAGFPAASCVKEILRFVVVKNNDQTAERSTFKITTTAYLKQSPEESKRDERVQIEAQHQDTASARQEPEARLQRTDDGFQFCPHQVANIYEMVRIEKVPVHLQ